MQVAIALENLDAVKEFSIRSIDGSKTTIHAFEALGLDAEEMMGIFADGGDDAAIAFQGVLAALMSMDDQVEQDAIGVELFGKPCVVPNQNRVKSVKAKLIIAYFWRCVIWNSVVNYFQISTIGGRYEAMQNLRAA